MERIAGLEAPPVAYEDFEGVVRRFGLPQNWPAGISETCRLYEERLLFKHCGEAMEREIEEMQKLSIAVNAAIEKVSKGEPGAHEEWDEAEATRYQESRKWDPIRKQRQAFKVKSNASVR